jgi:hypothetical protein
LATTLFSDDLVPLPAFHHWSHIDQQLTSPALGADSDLCCWML